MLGIISRARHDAIVAAKDAEIAAANRQVDHWLGRANRQSTELSTLRAKLARYTAPRQRDAKGHFLPLDQVQA